MGPFDLFDPTKFNPLDPQTLMGVMDPQRLLDAAQHFPGGAVWLVFALFWAPVGPGIPAGVLLARHIPLNPLVTFGLYTLSDVLGALVTHPMYAVLRQVAARVPLLRWLGQRLMKVAMFGTRVPRAEDFQVAGARGLAPALFRIGTVGFGVDVYTGGMLVAGLPVPRVLGWGAAIAGDLVWFALLLGTSLATAAVVDDDRVVGIVVLIAMLIIPQVAKRIFPALRDPLPARSALAARPAVAIDVDSLPPGHPLEAMVPATATGTETGRVTASAPAAPARPKPDRGARRGGGRARAGARARPRNR